MINPPIRPRVTNPIPNTPLTNAELVQLDNLMTRFWLYGPRDNGLETDGSTSGHPMIKINPDYTPLDKNYTSTSCVVEYIRTMGRKAIEARKAFGKGSGPAFATRF